MLCIALALSGVAAAQDGTGDAAPVATPVDVEIPVTPPPVRFASDQEVRFDAPSTDVFGAGQEVRIEARVDDNAFTAGQQVVVEAPVDGDLFAAGESIRIDAPVAGDLYAFGSEIVIGDHGSIGGDVFVGAKELRIDGPIGRGIAGGGGLVVLNAPVGGDVDLDVGELQLGPGAQIGGDLAYTSALPVADAERVVRGTVTFEEAERHDEVADEAPEPPPGLLSRLVGWSLWTSWSYGSRLLVGFVLLWLGGAHASGVARQLGDQPAKSLGIGFVVPFVLLIGSVAALVTIVPFPLGLLGLTALGVGMYVAPLVAAQALGDLALARLQPGAVGRPYVSLAVGLLPLVVIGAIPWLGAVAWFAAIAGGFGAIWLAGRSARQA